MKKSLFSKQAAILLVTIILIWNLFKCGVVFPLLGLATAPDQDFQLQQLCGNWSRRERNMFLKSDHVASTNKLIT